MSMGKVLVGGGLLVGAALPCVRAKVRSWFERSTAPASTAPAPKPEVTLIEPVEPSPGILVPAATLAYSKDLRPTWLDRMAEATPIHIASSTLKGAP